MNLLLLEDDRRTARAVTRGLRESGYEVSGAVSCGAALELVAARRFDAAILDLMVPGGSGYDVLRAVRQREPDLPVLILTARDAVADRIDGLERGADDYLVKPFAFAELLARLRALERRAGGRSDPVRIGMLEIDRLHRRASLGATRLDLTRIEFDLLLGLAERPGEVLGRRYLLDLVWGYRFEPGTNVVEVHVARLRGKLDAAGAVGLIRTVRGVGYVVDR
ncbi:MAG TPA: response regulator transcription factor [Myxococcota bacterium]|nr:response regulator transcription factor [Myxococcota bacterium]